MLYSIPFLLTSMIFIFFGYLILTRVKNVKLNLILSLLVISTVIWQLSEFVLQFYRSNLILKFEYIGIFFIPVLLNHFLFLVLSEKREKQLKFIYVGYFISGVFLLIHLFSNKIIDGYYQYFWGYHPKAGLWHPIFVFYVMFFTGFFIFNLYKKYKEVKILEQKKQYKYFLLAVIFYSISAINFIPNYGFGLYPIGIFSLWLFIGFMFYAIARYDLIPSSRTVLNRSFTIGILSITSLLFWSGIFLLEWKFLDDDLSVITFFERVFIINLLIIPIFIYFFIEFYKKIDILANDIFGNFDVSEQVRDFIFVFSQKDKKDDAIKYVLEKIPLILKSDIALLIKENKNYKIFKSKNFIDKDGKYNYDICFYGEEKVTRLEKLNLRSILQNGRNDTLRKLMTENEVSIIVTTKVDNGTGVCLMLQHKNDGSSFYKEEVEFLKLIIDIIGANVI